MVAEPMDFYVLVACEESQRVCTAFRKRGFKAFSCDIQEPSGGHPEWHILGDALKALDGGDIVTMDGKTHWVPRWDLLIAHPPCTYISSVTTRHLSLRCTPPEKVVERWRKVAEAAVFFMRFALADIPHIAVENPMGYMSTFYRKPDFFVHPYYFAESTEDAENYEKKRTCFWVKGLPELQRKKELPPPPPKGYTASGKPKNFEECAKGNGAKERSKTFPGIAEAMAKQWGDYIVREYEYDNA